MTFGWTRGPSASVAVLATILFVAVASYSQAPTGNIRGEVTDPSGAVIPNAKVRVTEKMTGRLIELTTSQAGLYTASLLLPGDYQVRIEASGFQAAIIDVTVRTGQIVDANAQLQVGGTGLKIEVLSVGDAQVDTTRATLDNLITSRQFDQMPSNGRNFLDLAGFAPGVQVRDGGNIDPTKVNAYRVVGIAGRGGTGTRIQIDGIDVTDEGVGSSIANISTEAVQEFQISRSVQDMSTSLGGSGAVSIISRGGGNQIRGSAFYFYRNQDMGARLQFLQEQPDFHRHQVGFRVGGPYIKDKLFWFVNWERTDQEQGQVFTSGSNFPTIDEVFPFGANAQNCASGCSGSLPLGIRNLSLRTDWNVRPNIRLFYRFGHSWDESTGGRIVSPFQNLNWTNLHTVALDWSHGRLTHSYRFGYVNFNNNIVSQELPGFEFPLTSQGAPYFLGVGAFALGPNSLAPQQTYQDNYQNKYDGSLVWGSHTFRFGLEFNHISTAGSASFSGILTVGGTFDATTQSAVAASGQNPQNPFAYPFDSFSTGSDVGFFTRPARHNLPHGGHVNNRTAWYFGDAWKARRNLTINIGTRWEYDSGYFPTDDAIVRPAYLDFWQQGASQEPRFPKNKFGPQVGFAWDPWSNGRTSIRGGFYLAYEINILNNTIFDPAALLPPGLGPSIVTQVAVFTPDGMPVTPARIGNPTLPASCRTAVATSGLARGDWSCLTGNSISSVIGIIGSIDALVKSAYRAFQFNPVGTPEFVNSFGVINGGIIPGTAIKVPYSQQFNIGIQREIAPGNVLSVDLVYNHGVGVPYMNPDFECRRCASTLNVAAAQARINPTIRSFDSVRELVLGATPSGIPCNNTASFPNFAAQLNCAINGGRNGFARTLTSGNDRGLVLGDFGFASDTVFQGRTPDPTNADPTLRTTNFLRMRMLNAVGYSKYLGLQAMMRGHIREKWRILNDTSYTISYALGRSEASNGSTRVEFAGQAPFIKNLPQDRQAFGPVGGGLDRTHQLTAGIIMGIPWGIRLNQLWTFRTAPALTLTVPAVGGLSGINTLFSTDLNGDGSIGTVPVGDILPGTRVGQFGRAINSWRDLNQIIAAYNTTVAGTLTPAAQALVNAGLFTSAQMVQLRGVAPVITPVPETNPWPFSNVFNLDLRITRPISLKRIREGMSVEPYFDVFNLFNHTGLNPYGGLGRVFGSLNFDYNLPANQSQCTNNDCPGALKAARGRNADTRLLQIGVRVNF